MLAKAVIFRLENICYESGHAAPPPKDLLTAMIPLTSRFANRKRLQLGFVSNVLALSRLRIASDSAAA